MGNSKKLNRIRMAVKVTIIFSVMIIGALVTFRINAQDTPKVTQLICYINMETEKSICNNNSISVDYIKLESTNRLEINGNSLKTIPVEIFKLCQLEELNVNSRNITSLPADIKKLCNLTILNLSNTSLCELPAEISKLIHLKEIHLPFAYWVFRVNEVKKITNANIILE